MASGKGKDKEKDDKKTKKGSRRGSRGADGGSDDVDTSEADLLALLANQVVKEEKKKLKAGLRHKKKGGKNATKKISKFAVAGGSFPHCPPKPNPIILYWSHTILGLCQSFSFSLA